MVVHCRVPEEAPQEIADLVLRCTGQAEQRPSAAEAADIIGPFAAAGPGPLGAARSSSGTTAQSRRASSGNRPASPVATNVPNGTPTADAPDT